jgi:hypothetical protein
MKRLIGKILLVILLGVVAFGMAWIVIHWKDLRAFQGMPSGAYAKFMCSSLFVEGKSEEQARIWSRMPVPVKEIQIDYTHKSVTARSLFHTSTARYVDERYGCTLE